MPRHTSLLPERLTPVRRAATTAGLTVAALVVGVGGYTVATSPSLAAAPGDRLAVSDLFGGTDEPDRLDREAVRRDDQQASRSGRDALAPGLPSTSAQAQSWVDEVGELEAVVTAETEAAEEAARLAAAEEAARLAAEEEAARLAAEEEAARLAAEEEAARVAAEEEAEEEEAERQVASADPGSNRAVAQSLLGSYGWGGDQWSCLEKLWEKESNWDHTADNPSSSAYGIPQALPGRKMSSAGSDWESNPETQIRWGLGYIDEVYGAPCGAWQHSVSNNWY